MNDEERAEADQKAEAILHSMMSAWYKKRRDTDADGPLPGPRRYHIYHHLDPDFGAGVQFAREVDLNLS